MKRIILFFTSQENVIFLYKDIRIQIFLLYEYTLRNSKVNLKGQ